MITVTGASGQLGRLVLAELLARLPADQITAMVRDPAKLSDLAGTGLRIVQGDYNAPETLAPALAGTDRLLIISGNEFGRRVEQYQALVAAAEAAGVGYIAYTSILRASENPMYLAQDHRAAEGLIAATGLPHAFLRNGWYSENYAGSIAQGAGSGGFIGASGAGRIAGAARADYAAAAAKVIAEELTGTYELGGPAYTMEDLAATIGAVAGRAVSYQNLPPEAFTAALIGVGLPEGFAQVLGDSDRFAAEGWLDTGSTQLAELIGRPVTPLAAVVKAVLG